MARTDRKKYNTLISNTLLFAISNFSSKLLSVIVQPYLSYALGDTAVMGVTKLASQCANLLIPLVSLGMSFAVIRFEHSFMFSVPAALYSAAALFAGCKRLSDAVVRLCAGKLPAHAVYPVCAQPYAEPSCGH